MARPARSELRLVQQVIDNMVRAGELQRAGTRRQPGTRKPLQLYVLAALVDGTQRADDRASTQNAALAAGMAAFWGAPLPQP